MDTAGPFLLLVQGWMVGWLDGWMVIASSLSSVLSLVVASGPSPRYAFGPGSKLNVPMDPGLKIAGMTK